MTDQTPDAAREAVRKLSPAEDALRDTAIDYIVGLHVLMADGSRGPTLPHPDGVRALDALAAAVSRARDAAWREAVEAVRKRYPCDMGDLLPGEGFRWSPCRESDCINCQVTHALAALLARMDTARAGGANG